MLGSTIGAVRDINVFVDQDRNSGPPPTAPNAASGLDALNDLVDQMDRLWPRAPRLFAGLPIDLATQARSLIHLADAMSRRAQ